MVAKGPVGADNGPMQTDVKQLDTQIEIVTPENIAFRYRVAGPFRRLPAYLIDLAVRVADRRGRRSLCWCSRSGWPGWRAWGSASG